MDIGQVSMVILLYLLEAFDTVGWEIMSQLGTLLGVGVIALEWIHSFPLERFQKWEEASFVLGPQGSSASPFLLSVYVRLLER